MKRPKPIAANAVMTAFIVRICSSRANACSTEIGSGSSSSITSPSTSFFSNCPRGGSGRRKANNDTIEIGIAKMTNTHRHALGPPIHVASPPTSNGLSVPVAEPKMLSVLPTRPVRRDRVGVGEQRRLHRERVRLRRTDAEPSEEQRDAGRRQPGQAPS